MYQCLDTSYQTKEWKFRACIRKLLTPRPWKKSSISIHFLSFFGKMTSFDISNSIIRILEGYICQLFDFCKGSNCNIFSWPLECPFLTIEPLLPPCFRCFFAFFTFVCNISFRKQPLTLKVWERCSREPFWLLGEKAWPSARSKAQGFPTRPHNHTHSICLIPKIHISKPHWKFTSWKSHF